MLTYHLRLRDSKAGPRDIIVGAAVLRFLKAYRERTIARGSDVGDPEFTLPEKREYETVRNLRCAIRREAALPEKLRLNDLRHSFASHAVISREPLLTTSLLVGHQGFQTTFRYAHLADKVMLVSAEKIGALLLRDVV